MFPSISSPSHTPCTLLMFPWEQPLTKRKEIKKERLEMPLAASRLEVLQVRKLIQCVRQQDLPQITKMIELGVKDLLDYQDPDTGESALHVACALNYDAIVTKLLVLGASTTVQDNMGMTPVMTACSYGHQQAMEALASKGIDASTLDNNGQGPLFHCMHPTNRHVKCMAFLLEIHMDPNSKSEQGTPILCAVCSKGLDKHLEKLLDKGADPSANDPVKENKPAIVLAVEGNHTECIKLLMVSGVDKNAVYGVEGMGAVHRAAELGLFESIQTLSAYGADFRLSISTGENAMHMATKNYRLLCTRLLGQRGCPANQATNEEGLTPQKIAKTEGYKDAMKELKKLTTFQDKAEKGGKPKGFAEPWAVRLYDWMVVNKIAVMDVLRGQDEERSGVIPSDKFTEVLQGIGVPLQSEEFDKLLKVYDKKGEGKLNYEDFLTEQKFIHAQYKLKPGDDIKKKAKKGKKGKKGGKKGKGGGKTKILFPIYYEQERAPTAGVPGGVIEREQFVTDVQRFPRDYSLPHTLLDDSPWYLIHPERQYMQLYEAVRHGNLESLQSALSTGLSVDCRDKYNKTPLMVAAAHGRIDVIKYLLEKGADVNAFDNFQWTALHHASHAGEENVVRLLLDAGGNIDAQSVNGGTPLMRAIETSQRDMVKLLMERGAKVILENKNGHTALEVARNWGDEYIYAILYAKCSSLPPPVEKKGKEKGGKKKDGGKGKGKKGKKGSSDDSLPKILPGPPLEPLPPPPRLPTPAEYVESARRRCSVGSMQSSTLIRPSPNYRPRPAWVSRPPSMQTHFEVQNKAREERGIERTDFEEMRSPFQLQLLARAQALEVTDP